MEEEKGDTPEAEVARRLLEAYGASGHPTDRLLLRCLRLLEAHDACNLASLVRTHNTPSRVAFPGRTGQGTTLTAPHTHTRRTHTCRC